MSITDIDSLPRDGLWYQIVGRDDGRDAFWRWNLDDQEVNEMILNKDGSVYFGGSFKLQ